MLSLAPRTTPRRRGERRTFVSFEAAVFTGLFDSTIDLRAADLSPDGLFLETDLLLERGVRLLVSFDVPGTRHRVMVSGEVVRTVCDPARPGLGIAFDRLTGIDEKILRAALLRRALGTCPAPDNDGAFRC